jgi:hypothetical protein
MLRTISPVSFATVTSLPGEPILVPPILTSGQSTAVANFGERYF